MKTILLIEDDVSLSWLLQRLLRPRYEVVIMNDALEALAWLTDGNSCDLIISDINLPTITGIELLEYLAESILRSHVPVIIISGKEEFIQTCIALGAYAFHLKPFQPQKLLNDIRDALQFQTEDVTHI